MQIEIRNTSILIHGYEMDSDKYLQKQLTVFDDIYFKIDNIAMDYDAEKKKLYVPRGFDLFSIGHYQRPKIIKAKSNILHKTDIEMLVKPRNNDQKKILMYLYGVGEFEYTTRHSQLMLTMPTGTGKTYCAIAAVSLFKARAIVINYDTETKLQWIKRMTEYTTVKKEEILELTPTNMKAIYNNDNFNPEKYKFYSTTHSSIYETAKNIGWENMDKLFEKLKIGIKIYDEAHREIKNTFRLDFNTNTYKTFYLTATPEMSDYKMNKIYQSCFSQVPEFGMNLFDIQSKDLKGVVYEINSNCNSFQRESLKTIKGLSSSNYSKYAFSDFDKPVFQYIKKALELYHLKFDEYRCIIYISTIDECELVKEFLINDCGYNKNDVEVVNSKVSAKDKARILNETKIIISTKKSLGTAKDIYNLRVLINTETFKSEVDTKQLIGRLRDGGLYIDCYDVSIPECVAQYKQRLKVMKILCKKVLVSKL